MTFYLLIPTIKRGSFFMTKKYNLCYFMTRFYINVVIKDSGKSILQLH